MARKKTEEEKQAGREKREAARAEKKAKDAVAREAKRAEESAVRKAEREAKLREKKRPRTDEEKEQEEKQKRATNRQRMQALNAEALAAAEKMRKTADARGRIGAALWKSQIHTVSCADWEVASMKV